MKIIVRLKKLCKDLIITNFISNYVFISRDILHNERPEHDRRRSSLRRAMSNISLNITHGIQKFTSRANLSFINENSSL